MQLLNQSLASGNIDILPVIQAVRADSATEVESILKKGLGEVQAIQNQLKEREVAALDQANTIAQQKNDIEVQKIQVPAQVTMQKTELDNKNKLEVQALKNRGTEDITEANRKNKLDEIMLSSANKEEQTLT